MYGDTAFAAACNHNRAVCVVRKKTDVLDAMCSRKVWHVPQFEQHQCNTLAVSSFDLAPPTPSRCLSLA